MPQSTPRPAHRRRPSATLRLRRVLALEAAILQRGVRGPVRFERRDGCLGAFGLDADRAMVEFRVDPYSGDIFEIEHDPAQWTFAAANLPPL